MQNAGQMSVESSLLAQVREYWNEHIHDLKIAKSPVGSKGFFDELHAYRFEKLHYLPRLVNFNGYAGKRILEIGCGIGIDLVLFAKGGASVTGVDLSETAINLARKNFEFHNVDGTLTVGNGEALDFNDNTFDMVYAHGVLQYTPNPQAMLDEIFRVLRPEGEAILMVYNRISWLNFLSKLLGVSLEHSDAPVLRMFSRSEIAQMLYRFADVRIVPERFPVRSRLHSGVKALFFNWFFVPCFNALPRFLTRSFGWHLMIFATK